MHSFSQSDLACRDEGLGRVKVDEVEQRKFALPRKYPCDVLMLEFRQSPAWGHSPDGLGGRLPVSLDDGNCWP